MVAEMTETWLRKRRSRLPKYKFHDGIEGPYQGLEKKRELNYLLPGSHQKLFVICDPFVERVSECIGVLRHMQRYFSYICDGTESQADWWRSFTYDQALNAIDIS